MHNHKRNLIMDDETEEEGPAEKKGNQSHLNFVSHIHKSLQIDTLSSHFK